MLHIGHQREELDIELEGKKLTQRDRFVYLGGAVCRDGKTERGRERDRERQRDRETERQGDTEREKRVYWQVLQGAYIKLIHVCMYTCGYAAEVYVLLVVRFPQLRCFQC